MPISTRPLSVAAQDPEQRRTPASALDYRGARKQRALEIAHLCSCGPIQSEAAPYFPLRPGSDDAAAALAVKASCSSPLRGELTDYARWSLSAGQNR